MGPYSWFLYGVKMLRLRAHHLLCTRLYEGKGYSEDFVLNMNRVVRELDDPGQEVQLLASPDDVCIACPNLGSAGSRCTLDNDNASGMDMKVCDALECRAGEIYTSRELLERLKNKMTPELFETVCGECSWHKKGVCTYEDMIKKLR